MSDYKMTPAAFNPLEKGREPYNSSADYARIHADDGCVLHRLTEVTGSFLCKSCGRCAFGYEGLFQIHSILTDISNKKGKAGDLELLSELCLAMQTQCACDIGEAAAKLILSAMDTFGDEIKEHITKKTCRAAFCKQFVTYHILSDKCVGCQECADACEDDAIAGKKKFVHVIDQDECTQCGKCIEVCEYEAIIKAGAIKPKCPAKPVPCKAG